MNNKIVIERLEFQGRCGVTPEERRRPQPLAVDLELDCDTAVAAASDRIADTVDYAKVAERIVALGEKEDCALLETFSEKLLAMLFAEFPVEKAKLWLRKLAPPLAQMTGSVGVKEERARAAHHGQQTELIPSRFLTQQLHRLPKGRVLDVASGRKLDSSPINRGWNYLPTIQWMQGMKTELDPRLHEWTRHERVILFDGVCNWCNAWVNFAIDRDPRGKFKLGTLQSEQAQQILKELQLSTEDFETFLLLEQTRIFTKSTAALRIARHLSGLWPLLYLFIVIPRPIRDAVYNYIARHRYKWMGKAETCRIPTPSERARFL